MSSKKPNVHDAAVRVERATLASIILCPALLQQIEVSPNDFLLADHRTIWNAITTLSKNEHGIDIVTLTNALSGKVEPAYIAGVLDDGAVPENVNSYVRTMRRAATDRRFCALQQELAAATNGDRSSIVDRMRELLSAEDRQSWRAIFHSFEELTNAPEMSFAISNFLPMDGITLLGGLSGHSKTLVALAMTRSLLTGEALFGHDAFSVPARTARVCYLVPESVLAPFATRLRLFRLQEFLRDDRLLVRTLSCPEQVNLDDKRILQAAQGSHVVLDTCARFMTGGEDAENARAFANTLFALLSAGAQSVVGIHHAPKSFQDCNYMTLENILRGSGDLGAMLSAAWGLRQTDAESNTVFVANTKARDFEPCAPFLIQGRPHVDQRGEFAMTARPGEAKPLREYLEEARDHDRDRGGRPGVRDRSAKIAEAAELRVGGMSVRQIAEALKVSKSTAERLLFDFDTSKEVSQNPVSHGTEFWDRQNRGTEAGGGAGLKDSPASGLGV